MKAKTIGASLRMTLGTNRWRKQKGERARKVRGMYIGPLEFTHCPRRDQGCVKCKISLWISTLQFRFHVVVISSSTLKEYYLKQLQIVNNLCIRHMSISDTPKNKIKEYFWSCQYFLVYKGEINEENVGNTWLMSVIASCLQKNLLYF